MFKGCENLFEERRPEFVRLPALKKNQSPVPRWQTVVDHNLRLEDELSQR